MSELSALFVFTCRGPVDIAQDAVTLGTTLGMVGGLAGKPLTSALAGRGGLDAIGSVAAADGLDCVQCAVEFDMRLGGSVRSERLRILDKFSAPSNLVQVENVLNVEFVSGSVEDLAAQLSARGPGARALVVGYRSFGAPIPAHMFNAIVNGGGTIRFWNAQVGATQALDSFVGNVDFLLR